MVFKILSGGEVRDEKIIPIELLARDEWGSSGEMAQRRRGWREAQGMELRGGVPVAVRR